MPFGYFLIGPQALSVSSGQHFSTKSSPSAVDS